MSIKTFKRYEKKYLLDDEQFRALQSKLMQHMNQDDNCCEGRFYSICNIYYDTEGNDVIRQSISKPYYKEKLRLRSYNVPSSQEDKVFLELKKKIGGVVSKRRAAMTLKEAYEFVRTGQKPYSTNYVNSQVIEEIAFFLSNNIVLPKVLISYERMAYFGKENKELRLTLDRNIKTRRNNVLLEEGAYGKDLLPANQYLMEIKISSAVPLWLAGALSELEIYSTSFSKYGREYVNYCHEHNRKITAMPYLQYSQPKAMRLDICANQ